MFKKFFLYLTSISLALLLCFYGAFKVSYKSLSKSHDNTTSNNEEILLVSPTPDKNNKFDSTKKENINNEEKKEAEISKDKKEAPISEKPDYKYEDFFKKLKELGFYKVEFKDENINFRNAVLRFQSSQNIIVDGIIGPETTNLLMKEKKKAIDVLPKNFANGYCIIINKDTRILTVYYDKNIYKKYPIAAGSKTVPGGIAENPLGKRWLGLSIKGGSIYGIHGNNNPWSIGTNASLGCIRMINTDVEELYDYIPINSPVWIGTTKDLNSWGVTQK